MPIGLNLWVVYVAVVLVVIVVEIRRRWQHSMARGEEVRRLVARVAEEEEAVRDRYDRYRTSVYVEGPLRDFQFDRRPIEISTIAIQYECVFCLSPATTRCARCKAARYCSGKCQILHWREGHKNDCRPFTTPCQLNDFSGCFSQKVSLQQEGREIYINSFESEGRRSAESVQKSERSSSAVDFSENDNEVGCVASAVWRGTDSDEPDKRNGHSPYGDELACSDKPIQIKPSVTNHDVHFGLKGSSKWNVDGTPELSITTSYMPLPGFQEGTINSSLPKMDSNNDYGRLSSPLKIRNKFNSSILIKGSDDVTNNLGAVHSTTLGTKKTVNSQSDEECECGSHLCSEKSDDFHMCSTNDLVESVSKGTIRAEESSISTYPPKRSSMNPMSPHKADQVTPGTGIIMDPTLSKKDEIMSSAFVVNLSSIAGRRSFQSAKTGEDYNSHASDATSFDFSSSLPNSINGLKTSMQKVVDQLQISKSPPQSRVGREITARYKEKDLFPYELFLKLYNWKNVELQQPCGLLNSGNSCYANAVLQCLACTPALAAYLLQGLHSKACKRKEWCFTCEFQSLILRAKESNSPWSPAAILSKIHKIKSHFGNGKEEDAHEFLRYVIDTMQSASLRDIRICASGSLEEETTLLGLTFGGYLRSKIKCMKCGAKSAQSERMMDLAVEIEGDVDTLDEALRKFTSTEFLDGENKYQCSRSYERAKKKYRILEAPNVLTIALKRFQSGKYGKLNKWIRFPEILDLAPFMSGKSDKSPIYRLYGVLVHLDFMNATYSGHYVCYVKNAENQWFKIDDSRVNPVDLESVLANRAYMLFYARCSPRAPELIRNLTTRDKKKSKGPPVKSRSQTLGSPPPSPLNDQYNESESFHSVQTAFQDDSSSENASSIFSEECSCSTESSNKDYSSTDDHFDYFLGNFGNDRTSYWKYSSSFSSSSSSSSSSKTKVQDSYLNENCRKLGSSGKTSCRETHSNRLGWANPFSSKKSGLFFRKPAKERIN